MMEEEKEFLIPGGVRNFFQINVYSDVLKTHQHGRDAGPDFRQSEFSRSVKSVVSRIRGGTVRRI